MTTRGQYDREVTRLYLIAVGRAQAEAGGIIAFNKIGPTYRKALVGNAILDILFQQDEIVPDKRVRDLLMDLRIKLMDDERLL